MIYKIHFDFAQCSISSWFWSQRSWLNAYPHAVNSKGETLLHITARSGNLAHARLLINYGASIDIQNQSGETPLHVACKKGDVKLFCLLLGSGADYTKETLLDAKKARELSDQPNIIELTDRYMGIKTAAKDETLLHWAVKAKIVDAVRVLSQNVDVNKKNGSGETALHMAIKMESLPIIRILLSQEANLEDQDDFGFTPLWTACVTMRNVLLVRMLIAASANKNHKDKTEQTLIQKLAEGTFPGKEQILKLLQV